MGRMKEAAEEIEVYEERQPVNLQAQFKTRLQANWDKISSVAARNLNPDRLFQLVVSTANHNPKLLEADVRTLLSCVMTCASLGLEPSDVNRLGHAYILPFWNHKAQCYEATFILGYKGMIELARRSGEIKMISGHAVYEGDEFYYEYGLEPKLVHVPNSKERTSDKLTHVYMTAHFMNGGVHFGVMDREEVEHIRKTKSKSSDRGPWKDDYEAMAIKTVVRREWKYLPVGIEAQEAVTSDETSGAYVDAINIDNYEVIDAAPGHASLPVDSEPMPDAAVSPPAAPSDTKPTASAAEKTAVREQDSKQDMTESKQDMGVQSSDYAECAYCGNRVEAVGKSIKQLNKFLCCEHPDYRYV